MAINFHQSLMQYVTPRLSLLGYEYNDSLRAEDWIYGFSKHLGGDIHAILLFQVDRDADPNTFSVELLRYKTSDVARWYEGLYEGALKLRLGELLRSIYGLWLYPFSDPGREIPNNAHEIQIQRLLDDVVEKVIRYGIPWVEDPLSRSAAISIQMWNEFQQSMPNSVAPAIQNLGYEMKAYPLTEWSPSQLVPPNYFRREVATRLYGFIIFHPLCFTPRDRPRHVDYFANQPTIHFEVLLFRKRSEDPYDQSFVKDKDCFQVWFSRYLSNKLDLKIVGPEPIWKYTARDELEIQLRNAVGKIQQYGIPLLESPSTI